jgi:hypothetical protein
LQAKAFTENSLRRKPMLKEKQIIFSFLAQVLSLEKKERVV